jgi:hypothetical protein
MDDSCYFSKPIISSHSSYKPNAYFFVLTFSTQVLLKELRGCQPRPRPRRSLNYKRQPAVQTPTKLYFKIV